MSSYQCTDGLVSHNACATGSTGNIKRTTGKLHERLWPNIKLQKWGKNRRIQSVHSEEPTCSLQKCYSADDNMLGTHMSLSNSVDEEIIYEDHCIVPNIHIRAATIDKLVEELLIHIEQSCESLDDISDDNLVFPKIFFLVHNWFSTSESIGRKLYNNADIKHKSDSSFEDDRILRSNRKFKIGGVTLAFCLWIEFYPNDFMGSESCMPILTKFIESLQEMGREDLITTLEKSLNSSYDRSRGLSLRMSVRQPVSNSLKLASSNSETCSLVFNQIHPLKLAEQLTVIEFKAFRRITIQDLKLYSLTATVRNIPTLERSVYIFNGLSQWVQCMILNKTAPSERAKVVEKFLLIAENLLVLQNFNSFYAVIGGITHSAISRMNATMMSLSISAQKMLEEYTKIISSSNNYSNYRQLQKEAKGFHIPVVAVHLKDLIFYHTALPDHLYNRNLINFRKFAQSAATLQSILDQQLTQMCIEQNIDLCNTLRLSLDLQYTEEDIYELSLAREPKSSIDSPVANKSILFGDFVSGVKPPTVDVLKQHVNGMVEAVFKVYDNDKDGLISSEEFELVAENFPFIDSFAVLDADKDGVISKYEMKMYFLKANHNALKNSFKHEFYENTYFKPTFCTHCTGLVSEQLWGLIKQGWRCRDCGINAHKHCKEQVVMECRSRGHLYQHNRSSSQSTETNVSFQSLGSPPCSSRQITIDRKRKMSQQRKKRTIVNVETQTSGILSESDMSTLESTSSFEKESNHVCIYSEDDPFDDCDKSHLIETLLRYQKEKNELEIEIKMMQEKFKIQANNIEILQDTVTQLRQKIVKFVLDIMDIFNNH